VKRMILSALLGITGFCVTYLCLCYLVPGWRIKLAAEPVVYFVESLKSMAFLKGVISIFVGALLAAVPYFKRK